MDDCMLHHEIGSHEYECLTHEVAFRDEDDDCWTCPVAKAVAAAEVRGARKALAAAEKSVWNCSIYRDHRGAQVDLIDDIRCLALDPEAIIKEAGGE